jgi:hypothetical protein
LHLILTDQNGETLYDFGNGNVPFWFDRTTFGFWTTPENLEDAILYYGMVDDDKVYPLFAKSELLPLLPAYPKRIEYSPFRDVSAKVGQNTFILSFSAFYDEPEPQDVYSFVVGYDLATDSFDVLWQSYGRYSKHISPDGTKIYVSNGSNDSNQIVDLSSGQVSITNWLPFNLERTSKLAPNNEWLVVQGHTSDLSFNGEWLVVFEPDGMMFASQEGFQEFIEYPEKVSDCNGGWIFK